MTRQIFIDVVLRQTSNASVAETQWNLVETAYSNPDRHFHTPSHLQQMYGELLPLQNQIEDWDSLLLALFFHDYVYDVVSYMTDNDNEDKSAEAAKEFLQSINYPAEKIERVVQHILATKKHEVNADADTNFLTDADLSIWGQPWELYSIYMRNVREEYAVYPDNIFNAGRVKFLKTALQMERIFKTDHFSRLYDTAAKENLNRELEILSFA
jgi:predicted metal-dependent HD superfamily phosphohydrolase